MALFKKRLVKCYKCGKAGDIRDMEQADMEGWLNPPDWYAECFEKDGHFCQECSETLPHIIEEEIDPGDLDLKDNPPLKGEILDL
tara:strand:+ start:379 stop:633 length:255 start_codon:yes stop_codon:yes gene_type:complete